MKTNYLQLPNSKSKSETELATEQRAHTHTHPHTRANCNRQMKSAYKGNRLHFSQRVSGTCRRIGFITFNTALTKHRQMNSCTTNKKAAKTAEYYEKPLLQPQSSGKRQCEMRSSCKTNMRQRFYLFFTRVIFP